MSTLYSLAKAAVAPAMRVAWRPKVTGLENVPATGPVIMASNHLSVIDSFIIPIMMARPVYFLAKNEYFEGPVMRTIMTGLNQIPVDRSGGRASLMALDAALPVLRDGQVLGIFPEGTRSPDGRLYRGRPGVAKLALDAGATVLPVGLLGTERIQPIGARWPRVGATVEMRVGEPLDLSPWRDVTVDSRVLREIAAALMAEIQKLTGQEYVGRYAPKREATPAQ
ncbi:1-acyl-sn-glycerol-3-phosphate acyltransferase [Planosporangium flavigriseum]|uniref:lysophospholipid acyltransferase family protein n=1 Tax=Planosporangium flavigriseum TaxID=373681 RepID=UPI00143B5ADE|nr:lysophospholipid acyltransferase family protein [Planosporangium flavigriseum]NJC66505.1 1-acyl-sn-glycerol-3-phosphate acyltransferase [Planosporangium flavigriseum]